MNKIRNNYTHLDERMYGLIAGPIRNEELHVFVFDLSRCWSDILDPHVAHFLMSDNW